MLSIRQSINNASNWVWDAALRIPVSSNILCFTFELENDILEHKEGCCETAFIPFAAQRVTVCLIEKLKCEEVRVHLEECWENSLITSYNHEQASLWLALTGQYKLLVIGIPLLCVCACACVRICLLSDSSLFIDSWISQWILVRKESSAFTARLAALPLGILFPVCFSSFNQSTPLPFWFLAFLPMYLTCICIDTHVHIYLSILSIKS